MPSQQQHLRQAKHNRDFITALDPATTPFLDWVVTVAFYVAVHRIEAWLAVQSPPRHSTDHASRGNWIGRVRELKPIYPSYQELERHSRKARYDCQKFTVQEVTTKILPLLEQIEQTLDSLP